MLKTFSIALILLACPLIVFAQNRSNRFDPGTKVFRRDGGGVSYVFGVNTRGELQQLYWGGRLGASDNFPQAKPMQGC